MRNEVMYGKHRAIEGMGMVLRLWVTSMGLREFYWLEDIASIPGERLIDHRLFCHIFSNGNGIRFSELIS